MLVEPYPDYDGAGRLARFRQDLPELLPADSTLAARLSSLERKLPWSPYRMGPRHLVNSLLAGRVRALQA